MAFWDNMKETEDPSQKVAGSEYAENNSRLFHEERMKNAPQIVRDYYDGTAPKFEKGLFRALVSTKSNRLIFLVMIFCFAIVFIANNFSNAGNLKVVSGYECELQAFSYDGTLFASVKIHPLKETKKKLEKLEKQKTETDAPLEFPVRIEFYGVSEDGISMKLEKEASGTVFLNSNIYRTDSEDYNIQTVVADVFIGGESGRMSVKVSRKIQ